MQSLSLYQQKMKISSKTFLKAENAIGDRKDHHHNLDEAKIAAARFRSERCVVTGTKRCLAEDSSTSEKTLLLGCGAVYHSLGGR